MAYLEAQRHIPQAMALLQEAIPVRNWPFGAKARRIEGRRGAIAG
jgi:hypothetical protein